MPCAIEAAKESAAVAGMTVCSGSTSCTQRGRSAPLPKPVAPRAVNVQMIVMAQKSGCHALSAPTRPPPRFI
jgi:hypothetical protein